MYLRLVTFFTYGGVTHGLSGYWYTVVLCFWFLSVDVPLSSPVFRIQSHKFLGLQDPLVRGTDPDPGPSIIKHKIVRKTLIFTILWLLFILYFPSKINEQKNLGKKLFFVGIVNVTGEKSRIWVRIGKSVVWIPGSEFVLKCHRSFLSTSNRYRLLSSISSAMWMNLAPATLKMSLLVRKWIPRF